MANRFEDRTGEMHNMSDPAFRDPVSDPVLDEPIGDPVVDPLSRPFAHPMESSSMGTRDRRTRSSWLPLILGALVALGLIFWFTHNNNGVRTAQNAGTTATQTVNPAPTPPAAQPPAAQPPAPNP